MRMSIRYVEAPDVKKRVDEIATSLNFAHIVAQHVSCARSEGSKSRRAVARIHGLGKIWHKILDIQPCYIIEVISERYDKLSEEDKEKTLIHELLHIPKGFSGGFRPHKGYVDRRTVEKLYRKLQENRKCQK